MSQERHQDLQDKARQLLQGSLKHARAIGLAATLVPLAAVPVAGVEMATCPSGGNVCGFVWNDLNNNGVQDSGEAGIEGAVVTVNGVDTFTDMNGFYEISSEPGTFDISVQIPPGTQVSPPNSTETTDSFDSDGVSDGLGNSVAADVTLGTEHLTNTDFGFYVPPVAQVGTGTPGYWMNHPEAWPGPVVVGDITYSVADAIAWIQKSGKDKTLTMFSSLVSAKLNVAIGTDSSCVASTIAAADDWMRMYGPVGRGVHAASYAWKVGEPLHRLMDNYNNGMLCAPHRD